MNLLTDPSIDIQFAFGPELALSFVDVPESNISGQVGHLFRESQPVAVADALPAGLDKVRDHVLHGVGEFCVLWLRVREEFVDASEEGDEIPQVETVFRRVVEKFNLKEY